MCGIIGYIGPKPVVPVLLDGLRRMEYRGYDSAGVAVVSPEGIALRRSAGKLVNLENAIRSEPVDGLYGVGHTRWATHGRPTEENAHPHRDCSGRIVVVHNGIIENYLDLKRELQQQGHRFVTETDTEIVAHLVEREMRDDGLENAVRRALMLMRGLFALVLWLKRREDSSYLLFSLATVAWLVRNLHYHLDLPRTRDALEWFWWVTHASMSWVMLLTFLFALRFARQRFARFERGMALFVLVSSLASMPLWGRGFDALVLLHICNAVVGLAGTAFVASVAWRQGTRELRVMALALVVGVALGVHDLGLLAIVEHGQLVGFNVLVGGGMGVTPSAKKTFPALAPRPHRA